MKKIKLILFLAFVLSAGTHAVAQQVTYVGIPREDFNYFASSQRSTNWCWAASLQMIFNYYGVDITQEEIVERSYGTEPDGELPDWAGSLPVITANLNNWSVDNSGREYVVRASLNWGAPTPAYLIQELAAQHPVLIGYQSSLNSYHAVVITACSYIQTNYGPIIKTLIVRDPWPSARNIATGGRIEYRGISLARLIQTHWYIRVQ